MKTRGLFLVLACAALLVPSLASAQATRTWISGVGDDVNPCSRTAPCKTFPGAIVKTAAGGEIDTLDPGGFGAVTVTKAITLADEGVGEGGILVAGTNGITINCSTDPTCTVVVRGLQIDGGPIGSNSLSGIKFIAGKTLIVQNCVIRNFTGGSPNGYGIWFAPSSGTAQLIVDHTTLQNNTQPGGTGGGIFVQPSSGSPSVTVAITNTVSSNNGFGFRADSSLMSGGSIYSTISDSTLSQNQNAGIAAVTSASGGITNVVAIQRTTISHNPIGLNANGSAAALHIGNSILFDSTTQGVKLVNGGTADSTGGNTFFNNPTGPGPTLTINSF